MRILIVNDNASLRQLLASLFTDAGHEVVALLEDGSQQVEAEIKRTQPDIICLDYNLPGRDGITILQSIHSFAPQIDVLFMTARMKATLPNVPPMLAPPALSANLLGRLRSSANSVSSAKHANMRPAASESKAKPHQSPRILTAHKTQRGTAVIADDSGSVRLVLKGLLQECGLRVVQTVANGNDAVIAARNHQPQVLCLDVNMPEMGALEALPLIRAASPQTAVVMVTGNADKTVVAVAASHGASGYVVEPLRPAHVIAYMDRLFK